MMIALDGARLLALAGFAIAALWTPGPNNILLARSGAEFGIRRTVPHALGVSFGFAVMLFAIALGLGELFRSQPAVREVIRFIGIALMMYLAWRIANAGSPTDGKRGVRPFRFYEACAFQWINPKAWVMSITASAAFVTGVAPVFESAVVSIVFATLGLTSSFGWTTFGMQIGKVLKTESHRRMFGIAMGVLLALCAVLLAFDDLSGPVGE